MSLRLDLSVKLNYESIPIILFVGIDHFLTSVSMPYPQTSDMRQIR